MFAMTLNVYQVTANHSISLAQFDYTVEFEEEYREAIASGHIIIFLQYSVKAPSTLLQFLHALLLMSNIPHEIRSF